MFTFSLIDNCSQSLICCSLFLYATFSSKHFLSQSFIKPASHGTKQTKLKIEQATKGVKRKPEDSQLDDDAFTTPTKCARKTRTVDDLTSRTVKENFVDFNNHQLHVLRAEANDNRTLIEELVMQNHLRMSNSPMAQKTGKNDYSHHWSLYQLDDSPINK